MGRSRRGTWWDRRTRRSDCWGTQRWCSAWRWGCWLVAATCLSLDRSTEPVTESETDNWRLGLLVGLDRPHTPPCNCCLGRRKHLPSTDKGLYFDVTDTASWLQTTPRRKTEHLVNQELWSWHEMCAATEDQSQLSSWCTSIWFPPCLNRCRHRARLRSQRAFRRSWPRPESWPPASSAPPLSSGWRRSRSTPRCWGGSGHRIRPLCTPEDRDTHEAFRGWKRKELKVST